MTNIAVFASGQGSNLQALIDAIAQGYLRANLALVVCDCPGAYCLVRAKNSGIPSFVFNPRDYSKKAHYEQIIKEKLDSLNVEFLILAGYMRLIGPTLLDHYPQRIINIHPSLLPLFPGKDAIGQALAAGVGVTGVTVHYVDEGMDTGPIITQEQVYLEQDETRDSLEQKIHALEHRLYPQVLQNIFGKKEDQNV